MWYEINRCISSKSIYKPPLAWISALILEKERERKRESITEIERVIDKEIEIHRERKRGNKRKLVSPLGLSGQHLLCRKYVKKCCLYVHDSIFEIFMISSYNIFLFVGIYFFYASLPYSYECSSRVKSFCSGHVLINTTLFLYLIEI